MRSRQRTEALTTCEIALDATNWKTWLDFYAALLPAMGAPASHSAGVPAIVDSMINGGINKLKPPYVVRIYNMGGVPADVAEEVGWAVNDLIKSRAYVREHRGYDVNVSMEVVR